MLPRRGARGRLFMTRNTRRKTPDENGSIDIPAMKLLTGTARPGREASGGARSAHGVPMCRFKDMHRDDGCVSERPKTRPLMRCPAKATRTFKKTGQAPANKFRVANGW